MFNFSDHDNELRSASALGDAEEVRRLIPLCHFHDYAIDAAVMAGHMECVKLLIPSCKRLYDNKALYTALFHDRIDMFQLLLPHATPKANNNNILFECSRRNLFEYVKLLIPVCDVSDQNSIALIHASMHKNQEMFDLFYPHCNAKQALKEMKRFDINSDEKRMLKDVVRAENERALLSQEVATPKLSAAKKKI